MEEQTPEVKKEETVNIPMSVILFVGGLLAFGITGGYLAGFKAGVDKGEVNLYVRLVDNSGELS